jgi:hypothetical protein
MTDRSSDTPLSDQIADLAESYNRGSYRRFISSFRDSRVGVVVANAGGEIACALEEASALMPSIDQDGKSVILAFADPDAFATRFGSEFNGTITGQEILEIVIADPECNGVRVNSALSEVSLVIPRRRVLKILKKTHGRDASTHRAWWRFW